MVYPTKIFMRDNGNLIKNKVKVKWIGLTQKKNILDPGVKINKMDLEFIFGLNKKVKGNFWGIDMKGIGWMDIDIHMVFFTMQMDQCMKANG